MKWSSFSNLSYPFYYAHSCIWLMKSQSCLWSRPSSRAHERLNVITIADVNMWISMVISHRKCCIMRFCVSLLQVSMCISISNCFSDNVSFWQVMSYLYEVTSCVRSTCFHGKTTRCFDIQNTKSLMKPRINTIQLFIVCAEYTRCIGIFSNIVSSLYYNDVSFLHGYRDGIIVLCIFEVKNYFNRRHL